MTRIVAESDSKLASASALLRSARLLDADGELEGAEFAYRRALDLLREILGMARETVPTESGEPARPLRVAELARRCEALMPEAEARIRGPIAARRRRRLRLVSVGLGLALVASYFGFALGVRPFARIHASGVFFDDPMLGGQRAFDRDVSTEWVLPDRSSGTLDLWLFPSRDVSRIVLVNGHNRQFADRASRRVEIRLHSGGLLRHVERASFEALNVPGERLELRLPRRIRDVDHVRVVVLDHFGYGAALAEVQLE